MKDKRPIRLSQPALLALMKILSASPARPGPNQLEGVLLRLELQQGGLTVSEILLRRELRALLDTEESREAIWRRLWM